jgi:hypothetical protein
MTQNSSTRFTRRNFLQRLGNLTLSTAGVADLKASLRDMPDNATMFLLAHKLVAYFSSGTGP